MPSHQHADIHIKFLYIFIECSYQSLTANCVHVNDYAILLCNPSDPWPDFYCGLLTEPHQSPEWPGRAWKVVQGATAVYSGQCQQKSPRSGTYEEIFQSGTPFSISNLIKCIYVVIYWSNSIDSCGNVNWMLYNLYCINIDWFSLLIFLECCDLFWCFPIGSLSSRAM